MRSLPSFPYSSSTVRHLFCTASSSAFVTPTNSTNSSAPNGVVMGCALTSGTVMKPVMPDSCPASTPAVYPELRYSYGRNSSFVSNVTAAICWKIPQIFSSSSSSSAKSRFFSLSVNSMP